ncbi:MAG: DUF5668 domain-containing protein [candidate division Zixibacteria bacterium]|nr:DUF5668 domain-containing protein [candidate division Zixibacteria bacterium]
MVDKKMEADRRGMLVGGVIVLGVGLIFLLSNMGVLPHIGQMWPMFPIIVGVALIVGAFYKGKDTDDSGQIPG